MKNKRSQIVSSTWNSSRIFGWSNSTWSSALDFGITLGSIEESAKAPTLDAHRMVHRTVSTIYYERNPYYFKIDPIGQQLPYIDGVISEEVESKEVITTMASTGQLDFSAYELRTQDIPLLKLGEQAGAINLFAKMATRTSTQLQTNDTKIPTCAATQALKWRQVT